MDNDSKLSIASGVSPSDVFSIPFYRNMGHDLRSPLNVILGYSEMLAEQASGEDREDLERINEAGKKLLGLINDTVHLAEHGNVPLDVGIETFRVRDVVDNAISSLNIQRGYVRSNFSTRLGEIDSDRSVIARVVKKIVTNLLEGAEHPELTVTAERSSIDGVAYVRFQFKMENEILDRKERDKLLSPFAAGVHFNSLAFAVVGLYLKEIGGSLSVADCPELTMIMSVPCHSTFSSVSALTPELFDRKPEVQGKVVIVSSDNKVAELLSIVITNEGCEPFVARNAEQIMRVCSRGDVLAIVLDLSNATSNDWKTISQVKQSRAMRDVPVILESVLDDGNMGFYVGPTGYLTKPIQKDSLRDALELHIGGGYSGASVLVVGDDTTELSMTARVLTELGCHVTALQSSRDAQKVLEEREFDIMFLDLILGDTDGFDLLQHIRLDRRFDALPIVVLTAKILTSEERSRINTSAVNSLKISQHTLAEMLFQQRVSEQNNAAPERTSRFSARQKRVRDALKNFCVLVVDDTEVSRGMLRKTLVKEGCRIVEVSSGEEALEVIAEGQVEAVLLDIVMPRMGGKEVLQAIRSKYTASELPVIMVTGQDGSRDITECLRMGANDYVTKPVDLEVLTARLETQAKLQRSAGVLAKAYRYIKSDLHGAAAVQRALLPKRLPVLDQAEFGYRFLPCDELGGDIPNIFRLDHDHVGMYILDVSGHGVQAAMLSTTLSHFLNRQDQAGSLLWKGGETSRELAMPADVVTQLNEMFPMNSETCQYFTIHYGILDLRTGMYSYVSAGFPAPILVSSSGDVEQLELVSPGVGLISGHTFQDEEIRLNAGDRLYLFSDGVLSARDDTDAKIGRERLARCVRRHRFVSVEKTLDYVVEMVAEWSRGVQADDMSCIGLDFKGK